MALDVRILTAGLVLLAASNTYAQAPVRCRYMTAIPREEKPDNLPEQNFYGLPWSQRPLAPADKRDDVCLEDAFNQLGPTHGMQAIYMDEEIEGDVAIAKLNYRGIRTPFVVMVQGAFNLLGPAIRRIPEDGDWYLVITQRQDYETPGMQYYTFDVRVDDEPMIAMVTLSIVNIDDNRPIIHLFEPCNIPELGQPGVTTCRYNVSDADGRISTQFMTFKVDSDRGDEDIFELRGENVNLEWMWMWMVLVVKEPLNFVDNQLHIFRASASDSLPNTHEVTMMVEVTNVEHRPPQWIEFVEVRSFDEKSAQSFRVRAIDADRGIDKPIHYRLETEERDKEFFKIETIGDGREGALFQVAPIDRDKLQREMFYVKIIAYKYGDNDVEGSPSFETPNNVTIIINDINDQRPEPFRKSYNIDIREETAMTLNLENFGFHDRDLGPHAQYSVHLRSVYPPTAHEAFYIAPEVGYQEQSFILGTQNHHMLDFEDIPFQRIRLEAVAIDMHNNSHVGIATININLINWNDELPMFPHPVQTVTFEETVGIGFKVGTALATDRDIDDVLEYSLLGNAVDYLRIDKSTGEIFVIVDDAFNYHRQNELFVQIRVNDTLGEPYNTDTSQLVIQLQDINNTPPTLRLPGRSPDVEENVPEGYLISDELRATDPDTTAELRFEVVWETSYATKQGRPTPAIEFYNCVKIETVYPDKDNTRVAIGRVVVQEIRKGVTIDYEEFEVLYLTVRVRDLNTVIGVDYDESTFTITIIDMNDNPPIWGAGQLTQQFRVREVSATGTVIGSVHATDIDGPLYNQIRYTIHPRLDTPEDLVAIDFNTGQISVKKDQAIDADVPPRHYLFYDVIASDQCSLEDQTQCPDDPTYWPTKGEIAIQILDTNNKVPQLETTKYNVTVYIYENATHGDDVVQLVASDLDRDSPNNKVSYQINYQVNLRLRDFFVVDLDTGLVSVHYSEGGDVLDRDGDEPEHTIYFNAIDNYSGTGDGNPNRVAGEVLVILLDVNDNAPELPEPHRFSWTMSESELKGVRIGPEIFAPDRDQPGHDNSRVAYAILGLTAERDIEVPALFSMITIETVDGIDQTGELETNMDLRGYWGTYEIHILAYDHGHPQQYSTEKYELIIRPYNYHDPVFVFPTPRSIIRLARERAVVNGALATVNGEILDRIAATDEDGLHAGTVTFEITGDDEAADYFEVSNDGANSGTLTLKQALPAGFQRFEVTIRATDGGDEPGPRSTDCTVTVAFIPQGEPVFLTNTATAYFIEKEAGLSEQFELPEAEDPKNQLCDGDCHVIYYTIIDGNTAEGHFSLSGRVLSLARELDRSEQEVHRLVVAASNSPDTTGALSDSLLTVTVYVREADLRPVFERELYTAGISTVDTINSRVLLTLHATHSEDLPITYSIDQESMQVDPSLVAVQAAFNLNPQTGELRLNFQPLASMHGMFEFDVVATDTNEATSRSAVKIYLISSANRVIFLFENPLSDVEANEDFIVEVFTTGFRMTCNIDQMLPASDAAGLPRDDLTEVRAHFIRDDLPVPVEVIDLMMADLTVQRYLDVELKAQSLVLADLVTGGGAPGGDALAVYVLAGVAALLALVCCALLIAFLIRNRVLTRRIKALSTTNFGSVGSGLNNIGVAAAPGANKYAVEPNPIWNENIKAPDFDAISDISNDSDLIGIEDLPQFRTDYFPPEGDLDIVHGRADQPEPSVSVANHGNNFGLNATPFSPEFANTQFRR